MSGTSIIAQIFVPLSLSVTESQPSSLNMSADGVVKSACSIILAARVCSLDRRSIFPLEVAPQVTEP